MRCIMCDKSLEVAGTLHAGGYVEFNFGYGSTKFDLYPGWTEFHGHICDDCAAKVVGKMECKGFDFYGKLMNSPPRHGISMSNEDKIELLRKELNNILEWCSIETTPLRNLEIQSIKKVLKETESHVPN